MKIHTIHCLPLLLLAFLAQPVLADYEPPTERQLTRMLANPDLVLDVFRGASPEEASAVLFRTVTRIHESNMNQSQKNYNIAYFSARVTQLMGRDRQAMAEHLLPTLPMDLVPPVLAGMSIGGRGSAPFMNAIRGFAGENEALLVPINAPPVSLTPPVYQHLVDTLGVAQSLPPVVTDSLPPPIPVGEGTPAPRPTRRPPVAPLYPGQQ